MGQEGWGKAQPHPQISLKPVPFKKHPQIQGSLPEGLVFRSAEHPLVPEVLHGADTTDCSGSRLVQGHGDTGTQTQPLEEAVTQPGKELDGVFTTFRSPKESCWELNASPAHISPTGHVCLRAQKVPNSGRKLNCRDGTWPQSSGPFWQPGLGGQGVREEPAGAGGSTAPASLYFFM